MDEAGRHHAHVEQLVAAGPHVEFPREEALGNAEDVQAGPAYVHGAHQAQPPRRVRLIGDGELEPFHRHDVSPRHDPIESEQHERGEAEGPVPGAGELLAEAHGDAGPAEGDEDGYVEVLLRGRAVERVVVCGDARARNQEGDAGVVELAEDLVHVVRVVRDQVEHERAVHARHGAQEEEEKSYLLVPRECMDLDVVEHVSDVVAAHEGPEAEDDEEHEPDEVGPYVPRLGVEPEHALETAEVGVHWWAMAVVEELVVPKPVRQLVERDGVPRPVGYLLYLHLHAREQTLRALRMPVPFVLLRSFRVRASFVSRHVVLFNVGLAWAPSCPQK